MALFPIDTDNPHFALAAALREQFGRDAAQRDQAGGCPAQQIRQLKVQGLLALLIPAQFGGAGQPWSTALRIVREFAKEDGSVAHLFGYHFVQMHAASFHADDAQMEQLFRRSASQGWFWSNTTNTFSHSLFGRRDGEHVVLNGNRPFSSGSHVADVFLVAWEDEDNGERDFAVIEADRPGITVEDDWDGIGQRQTGSGHVTYRDVRVRADEILSRRRCRAQPQAHATLTAQLQQSVLLNVLLGSAQGALEAARHYTLTQSRPWVYSGVSRHVDDPWIKRQYGELFILARAATALADRALSALDLAWARGRVLAQDERGAAAIEIAAANAYVSQAALKITSQIFEVMGARSATRANGFDRFWRNVRTHTLHNPVEYKTRNVGAWFLKGEFPQPSTFQ